VSSSLEVGRAIKENFESDRGAACSTPEAGPPDAPSDFGAELEIKEKFELV
jgi:hypothetical protein